MADFSESDYGKLDYGDGFYSYLPVWLFDAKAYIPVSVYADLLRVGIISMTGQVQIPVGVYSRLNITGSLHGTTTILFGVDSNEYLGKYWNPISGDSDWIPNVPEDGGWIAENNGEGPWIPEGPDMRPNKSW
jgi:hypothetical protein